MTKRINKPLPYPYDSIFENEENEIEDVFEPKKESKSISASSEGSNAYNSALPVAIALLLLCQNSKSN